MRIGIDISQIVYEGAGVATYVRNLIATLTNADSNNEYVLFCSSLRKREVFDDFFASLKKTTTNVTLRTFPIPPSLLDFFWNRLHIIPIEWFIGRVDIFWSSDWTQPPLSHAIGMTTIHDLSIFHFPESFHRTILTVQKRRLKRAKKECRAFLCDSEATKRDVVKIMGIAENKISVVYPGFDYVHTI
jgi:hypothetical protein